MNESEEVESDLSIYNAEVESDIRLATTGMNLTLELGLTAAADVPYKDERPRLR
jgi:hypothetical protein